MKILTILEMEGSMPNLSEIGVLKTRKFRMAGA